MTDIRLATADHIDAAHVLFEQYPYKWLQRRMQQLDPEQLNAFYLAGLQRQAVGGVPVWFAHDGEGEAPCACATLIEDVWHSEIYGMRMAKIGTWLNTMRPEVGAKLLKSVQAKARKQGYKHLSVRLDGADFPNLHLFEQAGWYLVDVSTKFTLPMPYAGEMLTPRKNIEQYTVELATPADADWIREIGSQHAATHFLNDPNLPANKTRELFARWIDRCLESLAYRIYKIRHRDEQDGSGFVIYLRNRSFAEALSRSPIILDFVLLAPEMRGGAYGPWLIMKSLIAEREAGFDYCELRTSAHNCPAMVCYEKLSFNCCATDMVLHKML